MTQEMIVAQDIPAPAALGLRLDGSVALVNSRDVAEAFGKQHAHVLRDIDALLAGAGGASKAAKGGHPNLDGLSNQAVSDWFRLVLAWHEEAQRETRSFDLTRDGFTLLVMGWTGERAMRFKVAYIQAFNAGDVGISHHEVIQMTMADPGASTWAPWQIGFAASPAWAPADPVRLT